MGGQVDGVRSQRGNDAVQRWTGMMFILRFTTNASLITTAAGCWLRRAPVMGCCWVLDYGRGRGRTSDRLPGMSSCQCSSVVRYRESSNREQSLERCGGRRDRHHAMCHLREGRALSFMLLPQCEMSGAWWCAPLWIPHRASSASEEALVLHSFNSGGNKFLAH